jgi:hypothetical protein
LLRDPQRGGAASQPRGSGPDAHELRRSGDHLARAIVYLGAPTMISELRLIVRRAGRILLLAGTAAALVPSAAQASFPGGDGVIAYSAAGSPEPGIWAVDPQTGSQLRLTSGATDEAPSFSASGNMLAFQRRVHGVVTIFTALADGSDATPLVRGSQPAFSPDGRELVFVRPTGLFLTGVAPGSSVHQITSQRGDRAPRWSSTGQIVFQRTDIWHVRNPEPRWKTLEQLDLVTPPQRHAIEVLRYEEDVNLWPEWSPNGRTIVVDLCTDRSIPAHLPTTVPSFRLVDDCFPRTWAPDGRRVARAGFDWGKPQTSCPRYIPLGAPERFIRLGPGGQAIAEEPQNPSQISWQPLIDGTVKLHTHPCEPRPEPGIAVEHLAGAAPAEHGVTVCVRPRSRHRHHYKRRCVS